MADIAVTQSKVAMQKPTKAVIGNYEAGAAINKGDAVYIAADGTLGKAYVDGAKIDSAALQFRGIALNSAGAGEMVAVLHDGTLDGFGVDALNVGAKLYLSGTAGALADTAPAAASVVVGVVDAIPLAGGGIKKVVRIQTDWLTTYTFAA